MSISLADIAVKRSERKGPYDEEPHIEYNTGKYCTNPECRREVRAEFNLCPICGEKLNKAIITSGERANTIGLIGIRLVVACLAFIFLAVVTAATCVNVPSEALLESYKAQVCVMAACLAGIMIILPTSAVCCFLGAKKGRERRIESLVFAIISLLIMGGLVALFIAALKTGAI